jgi:outer membrane protein W
MNKLLFSSFRKPLAAAAVLLTVCSAASAQNSSASDPSPRYEIGAFGGAQFWSVWRNNKPATDSLVNGGVGGVRFTWDFARYFGLEAAWSIYAVNNLRLGTTQPYPVSTIAYGARNASVAAGPVFYFMPRDSKVRVFVTAGPAYMTFWPTKDAKGQAQSPPYAAYGAPFIGGKDGAALMYGAGVKFNFSEHFGMRVDIRDFWTKNPDFNLPSFSSAPGQVLIPTKQTINGLQTTLGIEYRFGGKVVAPPPPPPPPPPPTLKDASVSLSADQADVCPGTPVHVTAQTNVSSGAAFQWRVNGQPATGDTSLNFDTTGKSAGSYSISASVRAPGYNEGTGSTTVNVREYRQPTGSVTASPSSIPVGGTSQLSANFTGQCGGAIKPATYAASEGSISGDTFNSNGVAFDPNSTDAQSKSVTITATTTDEKGGSGSATTTVTVNKPANPKAIRLPDIIFAPGSSRVNNCGKRVLLEQLKTYLDRDPTGKVVFVGHFADREPKPRVKGQTLDEARALNAAAIISAGKGICLSFSATQILIDAEGNKQNGVDFQPNFCGTSTKERGGQGVKEGDQNAKYRRVEVYFVPTNAQLPSTVTTTKDATSLGVGKLGCPK